MIQWNFKSWNYHNQAQKINELFIQTAQKRSKEEDVTTKNNQLVVSFS
jgi:hypothetical protein